MTRYGPRYEVYELHVHHQGRARRVLAEFLPGIEDGMVRSIWDDTKGAWGEEYGWVPLLPHEAFAITRSDLRAATRRIDLTEALA